MDCSESWQDVFLTKPEYGGPGNASPVMDDVFVAPVMSVAVQRFMGQSRIDCKPSKGGSNWLALAFPGNAGADEIQRWRDLKVGDMMRVGTAAVGGFTDYLTVLETVDADRLYNTTSGNWQITTLDSNRGFHSPTLDTIALRQLPDINQGYRSDGASMTHLGPASSTSQQQFAVETNGAEVGLPVGSLRCVRINYAIDATTIDTTQHRDVAFVEPSTSGSYVTDATRGEVSVLYPLSGTRLYDGADRREQFYYPCYRQREWVQDGRPTTTVLRLDMPTNIKQVRAIKLKGYSLVHKRSVGTQQQHERKEDDWFAIRIKELRTNNNVLSNNRHADGSLHVLHCGDSGSSAGGSVELYAYEPHGLACASFSPVNLPSVTVEIVDRQGQEAHFGRMHLWLQVLVTRG
jgi:hypothetical protein